jgi:hypothetical protein
MKNKGSVRDLMFSLLWLSLICFAFEILVFCCWLFPPDFFGNLIVSSETCSSHDVKERMSK